MLEERNIPPMGQLETLYFGGGTPSLWGAKGAEFFGNFLRRNHLTLSPRGEWTMELNPGSWDREGVEKWVRLGVNRFSVGVQSFDNRFLKILDRVHREKEVLETLGFLEEIGVNYSVDFMIGLPFSQEMGRCIVSELEQILCFSPQHLSLYILTVPPQYIHFKDLPSDEFIGKEYLKVSEYLENKGMVHYEVSNFALPGKECQHNLQYWSMASVAAIGPSATGLLVKGEQEAFRYKWKTHSPHCLVLEQLTPDQVKLERLYMGMRTNRSFDPKVFLGEFEGEEWEKLLDEWSRYNYLRSRSPLCIGPRGFLMLDSLIDGIFSRIKNF